MYLFLWLTRHFLFVIFLLVSNNCHRVDEEEAFFFTSLGLRRCEREALFFLR